MADEASEPTPLQVQQARLVEESVRDAIALFVREGIPPACIDAGLKMAIFRFHAAERGIAPERPD